jgi:hypothetical protein
METRTLERYFEALRAQDWEGLGRCLAEDVHRTGPYLDEVRGRQAYVEFLSKVIPALRGYELEVSRTRGLEDGSALVELSEIVELDGVRTEFPEALLFGFDDRGLIRRVDIYVKSLAGRRQGTRG